MKELQFRADDLSAKDILYRESIGNGMNKYAVFDSTQQYRYLLGRQWEALPALWDSKCTPFPIACFVMLNPSTADEMEDDPTIRRCIGYAKAWAFKGVRIVNIFALRSTDPTVLKDHSDPIGKLNDLFILESCRQASFVVCAWGNHGALNERASHVYGLLSKNGVQVFALKINKASGQPSHPLYLRKTIRPAVMKYNIKSKSFTTNL